MYIDEVTEMTRISFADFQQIVEILGLQETGPDAPVYEEISYVLAYGGAMFLARQRREAHILGVATLCLTYSIGRRDAVITHVTVPKHQRGKKIGVHLLHAMVQYARNRRVQTLRLLHPLHDEQAMNVFREHEFGIAGTTGLHERRL